MLNLVKSHRPPSTKVFGARGADCNVMERVFVMPRMAPQYLFISVGLDSTAYPQRNL